MVRTLGGVLCVDDVYKDILGKISHLPSSAVTEINDLLMQLQEYQRQMKNSNTGAEVSTGNVVKFPNSQAR